VSALKDPISANLDRIQIVKGWVDRGQVFEKIYDMAWSGDREPNPGDGKLPAVGNTVKVADASYTNDIGAPELSAAWVDPEFDPGLRAFYYGRIIEIPTPRWSTYDAKRLGIAAPEPATIQERAWTSPIWYVPSEGDRAAADAAREGTIRVADLEARGIDAKTEDELRTFVVGNTLSVVNMVTGEEGLVSFLDDGVQVITVPPHRRRTTPSALHPGSPGVVPVLRCGRPVPGCPRRRSRLLQLRDRKCYLDEGAAILGLRQAFRFDGTPRGRQQAGAELDNGVV
jgi:hypothetical protein